jgi:hypothetical protein
LNEEKDLKVMNCPPRASKAWPEALIENVQRQASARKNLPASAGWLERLSAEQRD